MNNLEKAWHRLEVARQTENIDQIIEAAEYFAEAARIQRETRQMVIESCKWCPNAFEVYEEFSSLGYEVVHVPCQLHQENTGRGY